MAAYQVTVNAAENGTVTSNRRTATRGQTVTLTVGATPNPHAEILAQVKAGKKAYGFTDQHIEKVVPIILKGLGF